MSSSDELKQKSNHYLTKEEAEQGVSLRLKQGDIIRIKDWVNKNGTDVLFVVTVSGMYKIHGKID